MFPCVTIVSHAFRLCFTCAPPLCITCVSPSFYFFYACVSCIFPAPQLYIICFNSFAPVFPAFYLRIVRLTCVSQRLPVFRHLFTCVPRVFCVLPVFTCVLPVFRMRILCFTCAPMCFACFACVLPVRHLRFTCVPPVLYLLPAFVSLIYPLFRLCILCFTCGRRVSCVYLRFDCASPLFLHLLNLCFAIASSAWASFRLRGPHFAFPSCALPGRPFFTSVSHAWSAFRLCQRTGV